MTINPWLAEKVQEYRNQNKDSVLRADYEFSVQSGSKLSWDQHLTRAQSTNGSGIPQNHISRKRRRKR